MTEIQDQHHIVSAFDRDLEGVQASLMKMGGLVEEAIAKSAQALVDRDTDLAQEVRSADRAVDDLEESILIETARVIALRAPAASDLRVILTVMRISGNLERIGDYAKNIAKRTIALSDLPGIPGASDGPKRMAREAGRMLADALGSYVRRDEALAREVIERDLEFDRMYDSQFRELLTHMMEKPSSITSCMHLHFIAKNYERMGDHATSVAEQAVYLATGERPDGDRPKGDRTSEFGSEAPAP